MELAGRNLLNILSPSHGHHPYWSVLIDPQNRGRCKMKYASHNIGRWWDAMLRLEAATGFVIPGDIEGVMVRNLADCLTNSLGVCCFLTPLGKEPAGWVDSHSQREILLSLAGLVRYRGNRWAADQGSRMVRALDRYIRDDGMWDGPLMARLARANGIEVDPSGPGRHAFQDVRLTESHGRMIEGLLEFYLATGDDASLTLSDRLARICMKISTRPDGTVPEHDYVHTHSLFCTYRGLIMYGQLTRQHEYIDRVYESYLVSIRKYLKPSGFISHDWGTETSGETTSPGDAAQLALWLSRSGHTELLDDVERIVRSRLLASQITEPLGLEPQAADDRDEHARLEDRVIGAFGGDQRHPHGDGRPTTDITAAGLHTLCDIYTHIVEDTPLGTVLNFHFDFEDERLRVDAGRDQVGRLAIHPKQAQKNLLVRMPAWTPLQSIGVIVDGQPVDTSTVGPFLLVRVPQAGAAIDVQYDLPHSTSEEIIDGVTYRLKWRGDEVVGINPNTEFRPFYPTA